jgi:CheY-like chemotaxis protein
MNILLLENESCVTNVLDITLRRQGHTIWKTTSAQQAIKTSVSNRDFDLLIAAVNLPGRSGIEVALRLKAWMPNLKIILISGFPIGCFNDQHAALFSELPSDAVQFLLKPFLPADLLRRIDRLVVSRSGLSQLAATA